MIGYVTVFDFGGEQVAGPTYLLEGPGPYCKAFFPRMGHTGLVLKAKLTPLFTIPVEADQVHPKYGSPLLTWKYFHQRYCDPVTHQVLRPQPTPP